MNNSYRPDRTDRKILRLLQKNARLANKELARSIGVAQSTCLERVRRLRHHRILRGFHAEVDGKSLGIDLQALIAVRLKQHSRDLVSSFRSHALGLEEVLSIFHMAGENDFLVHVAVSDSDHLRELAMSAFTTRHEVAQIQTSLIFEHRGRRHLPDFLDRTSAQSTTINLDE